MLPIVKLPCFVETILPRFSSLFNKNAIATFWRISHWSHGE
jgi:hypothetical protein